MNPMERLEFHCRAMEQKYGYIFPMRMSKAELKMNCDLIDDAILFAKEIAKNGKNNR